MSKRKHQRPTEEDWGEAEELYPAHLNGRRVQAGMDTYRQAHHGKENLSPAAALYQDFGSGSDQYSAGELQANQVERIEHLSAPARVKLEHLSDKVEQDQAPRNSPKSHAAWFGMPSQRKKYAKQDA